MTMRELRMIRKKNDHKKLMKVREQEGNDAITFIVDDEENPEHYVVTFHIRTIVGLDEDENPIYRSTSVMDLTFPDDYPERPPRAVMRDPAPFHPNWYRSGLWDCGLWHPEEPLWNYIRRIGKTLQFDPKYSNTKSPSNAEAARFWESHPELFPVDTQELWETYAFER